MAGLHRPFTDRCSRARSRPSAGASKRHDLAPGVHPGVGAAGDGQLDAGAEHPLDGGAQRAPDGDDAGVLGEAVEVGAVVGDEQPYPLTLRRRSARSMPPALDPPPHCVGTRAGASAATTQTSSMRAIGALSPWRVPSFRMRV